MLTFSLDKTRRENAQSCIVCPPTTRNLDAILRPGGGPGHNKD